MEVKDGGEAKEIRIPAPAGKGGRGAPGVAIGAGGAAFKSPTAFNT